MVRLAVNLPKIASTANRLLAIGFFGALTAGFFFHFFWYYLAGLIFLPALLNFYLLYIQKDHTILRNFGLLGQMRYFMESIGPEMRQYFYLSDTEERPFNRAQRTEVYQKSKDIDSTSAFGSLMEFDKSETKLKHSFFPSNHEEVKPFSLTFGERSKNPYIINKHMMVSAMSFGSLGKNAIMALSKGAKLAGIPMNTGEGGLSPYHLSGGADLIFQMGTAKFGCRNKDHTLNEEKLKEIAKNPLVKMIEIKFSQGAKPGKGGLLPKEKITKEIAEIRHVPLGEDVVSPERHAECDNPVNTVKFIRRVQDISELPVGIKFCLGCPDQFTELVKEMKKQKSFPDYISLDGAEGGTGAAPYSFMDNVGIPLFPALHMVIKVLEKEKVRKHVKVVCAGKLINPGKQILALSHGADAVYTARGFMLAIGCIQALQCNRNTCPVGITTHDPHLQRGLDVEKKAIRVANYVKNCEHDFYQLLASMGVTKSSELSPWKLYESEPLESHL
jgi:glutamate synthase domain-containing protein 2